MIKVIKESVGSVSEVASFIKDSVDDLRNGDVGTFRWLLDDDLAIYVGWSSGFGNELRDDVLQDKESPDWAICVKIGQVTSDWYDYDYINQPIYVKQNLVYDTDNSISPNENYSELANYLLKDYKKIRELLDKKELMF